jgi:hypothetical protein
LRFRTQPSPVQSARLRIDALTIPVAPTDDVDFQATTQGGRVMDHILGNKAVFKTATDVAGDAAIIGGAAAIDADRGRNATADEVGAGLIVAGIVSKVVSAATTPTADTRAWDDLPHYLSFATMPLPPGHHTATVDFLDAFGQAIPGLTKTVMFDVPADGKDKVVFVSDQSITPLTI